MEDLLKERLRRDALSVGFDACRFTSAAPPDHFPFFQQWLQWGFQAEMRWLERQAGARGDVRQVLAGARSVLLLAASYHRAQWEFETSRDGGSGWIARYARYRDYHQVLRGPLQSLVGRLQMAGGAGVRSLALVDSGPLMERDLAQRAGLGFIGKHTNLISRGLGNWFFLAAVVTTMEFEPDAPEANHCGQCTRCLTACPTGAIAAPFRLDARRCLAYLTIEHRGSIPEALRPALGSRVFGCDDCLNVCPWNRFAREGRLMREQARTDLTTVDLCQWLSLDAGAYKKAFQGTPILRAKYPGFLRNVCVVLGNVGDASALPLLERASHSPEPVIAEHAAWARQRIQERVQLKSH